MRRKVLLSIMILLLWACSSTEEMTCPDSCCDNYTTQEETQSAFDADPNCLGKLDHDSDGIVCEHLLSGGTGGCPTTSNCGCSNKNKGQCTVYVVNGSPVLDVSVNRTVKII